MADINRDRSKYASDENWDQNREFNSRQNEYNQSSYGNVNYNRDYDRSEDWERENRRNRMNYGTSGYGGTTGYGNYGRYGNEYNQGMSGQNYGNYGRREDEFGRRNIGAYSSDYGYQGERKNYGERYGTTGGYGSDYNRDYYGQGYSGTGGYTGAKGYGNENYGWQNAGREPRNIYGGDTSNYGNMNQGGYDRGWWDRTRDEVSSWFGDEDAERRRRIDKVSTGSYRGKGPKNYHRSEDRIREDVCDRFTDDDMLDATDINVEVHGDEVVLTGNVESRDQKRRAEDLVESISGVRNVENRIHVGRESSTTMGTRTTGSETTSSERSRNK